MAHQPTNQPTNQPTVTRANNAIGCQLCMYVFFCRREVCVDVCCFAAFLYRYIEQALVLRPDDPKLVILLATCHQKWAHHVLVSAQGQQTQVTTAELEGALVSLQVARDKFNWLAVSKEAAKVLPAVQVGNFGVNADWCEETEEVARSDIEDAKLRDQVSE